MVQLMLAHDLCRNRHSSQGAGPSGFMSCYVGPFWKGQHVLFDIDNMAVVQVVDK